MRHENKLVEGASYEINKNSGSQDVLLAPSSSRKRLLKWK